LKLKKEGAVVVSLILSISMIKTVYCNNSFKDDKKQLYTKTGSVDAIAEKWIESKLGYLFNTDHNTIYAALGTIVVKSLDEKNQGEKSDISAKTKVNLYCRGF
jgi:hypothetical protein